MAERRVVVNVCDMCGKDDVNDGKTIKTHALRVDKAGGEGEFCDQCWAPIAKTLERALAGIRGLPGLRKTLAA